jgi:hypothetical protein
MAQPDLDRLAQGFQNAGNELQTASNEIALLRNLPPIYDRQTAHNNHQQLVGLIQNLTTRLDTVEQGLNTRLGNLDRRMTEVSIHYLFDIVSTTNTI